ncbi:MAG: sigma-54 dependent transcriptional regulator [Polyangiaceae bacterium]
MSDAPAAYLVVTDRPAVAAELVGQLVGLGLRGEVTAPEDAARAVAEREVDAVLVDASVSLPKDVAADVPLVMIADADLLPCALDAVRAGAADYLKRPATTDELAFVLDKVATQARALEKTAPASRLPPGDQVVGNGIAMKKLRKKLERAARGIATVLIQGETGTGKELVARLVHASSPRAAGPYVKVHCGALPDNLLESELFGYDRAAFTGADSQKPGRVELAEGGTLFLDEIGEVSPAVQVKLLRVLQEREYERLGGTETKKADVRFVAATHRDLKRMVKKGTFRQDLYYRLDVIRLDVPSLRVRADDIPALAEHFVDRAAAINGLPVPRLEPDAIARLCRHSWPGNVRQLQHVIERLVVMSEAPTISAAAIADELADTERRQGSLAGTASVARSIAMETMAPSSGMHEPSVQELAVAMRIAERRALEKALAKSGGNRNQAARLLGVSRRKLFYMLKDHELS